MPETRSSGVILIAIAVATGCLGSEADLPQRDHVAIGRKPTPRPRQIKRFTKWKRIWSACERASSSNQVRTSGSAPMSCRRTRTAPSWPILLRTTSLCATRRFLLQLRSVPDLLHRPSDALVEFRSRSVHSRCRLRRATPDDRYRLHQSPDREDDRTRDLTRGGRGEDCTRPRARIVQRRSRGIRERRPTLHTERSQRRARPTKAGRARGLGDADQRQDTSPGDLLPSQAGIHCLVSEERQVEALESARPDQGGRTL